MAKGNAVWGIDIGQCALKALQCRPHEKDDRRLVVESFDYIEYPKILTQPEADPAELIRDALKEFLSRNDLTGDTVAISVAGQSGLARFIKLPPVESKKIPDIVKYEARQQIPFSLDDVVWDYQQLTGGSEEDGFALEPEVGLFAMKRDQVARALAPLEEAGIEVDLIQLAPLAVYNYVCFDRLEELKDQKYDPSKPPPSTVVISLGTDTTDLVVTNGFRVWQRSIPIGGNHFTRALSKELKLTFVKAEHLKRNAMQADDPKAVFQAMRPVFSDLLAEIQRSLGYFMSLDKSAHIGEVVVLGNAMKLPGLQRYLAQNLEQEVKPIEDFNRLTAGSQQASTQFKENILSFAPAYGLCVQGLGKSELKTNLLPEEIVKKRMIRAKKPWAVAGVAAVLAGLTFNYFTHVSAWRDTNVEDEAWKPAFSTATTVKSSADTFEGDRLAIKEAAGKIIQIQDNLTSNVEGRLAWLELIRALDAALPKDKRDREDTAEHVMSRTELHIKSLDAQDYADVMGEYFTLVEEAYWASKGGRPGEGGEAAGEAGTDPAMETPVEPATTDVAVEGDASAGGSTTAGKVIQLTGFHYHNADKTNDTRKFVATTLLKQLEEGTVTLPDGPNGKLVEVPIKDLGISKPWLVVGKPLTPEIIDPDAGLRPAGSTTYTPESPPPEVVGDGEAAADGAEPEKPRWFEVQKYDFVVQFIWQPTTRSQRQVIAKARAEAEAAAKAAAEEAAAAEGEGGEEAEPAAEDVTATP
jgi:type IV pilus assembly protein PilM